MNSDIAYCCLQTSAFLKNNGNDSDTLPKLIASLKRVNAALTSNDKNNIGFNSLHLLVQSIFHLLLAIKPSAFSTLSEHALSNLSASLVLISQSDTLLLNEIDVDVLWKLLIILTGILESCKSLNDSPLTVEKEEIAGTCLATYNSILDIWRVKLIASAQLSALSTSSSGKTHPLLMNRMRSLRGPYLAQLVQSCLLLSRQKSKTLAGKALQCLQTAIETIPHSREWKIFLPGIFSGLYSVCMSGYKRGSKALCAALVVLTTALTVTTYDYSNLAVTHQSQTSCPSNIDELRYNIQSAMTELTHLYGSTTTTEAKDNGKTFYAKIYGDLFFDAAARDHDTTSAETKTMPELPDTEKWRDVLLQKIESFYPRAFENVYKICGVRKRCRLVESISEFLISGRLFLSGSTCHAVLVSLLLGCTDDGSPIVRSGAISAVKSFMDRERFVEGWSTTCATLLDQFSDAISLARSIATSNMEDNYSLTRTLAIITGYALALGSEGQIRLRSLSKCLLSLAQILLIPDLDAGVRGLLLESRRFISALNFSQFQNGITIVDSWEDCAYYRIPLRGSRSEQCRRSARRLSALLGFVGLINIVEESVSISERQLEQLLDQEIIARSHGIGEDALVKWKRRLRKVDAPLKYNGDDCDKSADAVEKVASFADYRLAKVRHAISAWSVFSAAVLGAVPCAQVENKTDEDMEGKVAIVNIRDTTVSNIGQTATQTANVKFCSFCQSTSTLSLCSRCKSTAYCCVDHQRKHWPKHKKSCVPLTSQKSIIKTERFDNESSSQTNAAMKSEATDVMTSSTLSATGIQIIAELLDPELILTDRSIVRLDSCGDAISEALLSTLESGSMLAIRAIKRYTRILDLKSKWKMANSTTYENYLEGHVKLHLAESILAATATEFLANHAFILGPAYRSHLLKTLYTLLELSEATYGLTISDTSKVAQQAARTSLGRIRLYCGYSSLVTIVTGCNDYRDNLDYIVDEACAELRRGLSFQSDEEPTLRVHEVVGAVLHAFDDSAFELPAPTSDIPNENGNDFADVKAEVKASQTSSIGSRALVLLRDIVLDSIDSIDRLISVGLSSQSQVHCILKLMQALIRRAAKPVDLIEYLTPCEPTTDATDLNTDDKEEKEHENESRPTVGLQLVLDLLPRCTLMLSSPMLSEQTLVLTIIQEAYLRLATKRRILLPQIHQHWAVLMTRLKNLRHRFILEYPITTSAKQKSKLKPILPVNQMQPSICVSDPNEESLLVERSTVRRVVPPETKNANRSAYGDDPLDALNVHNSGGKRSLHLLASTMATFQLLGLLCGDFYSIRFQDDLWPELCHLLIHIHAAETAKYTIQVAESPNGSAKKLPTVTLRRSDLKIVNDMNPELIFDDTSTINHREQRDIVSIPQEDATELSFALTAMQERMNKFDSKFVDSSVYTRSILALLELLRKLGDNKDSKQFIRVYAPTIVWLILPLLSANQTANVQEAARCTVTTLHYLNTTFVPTLHSVLKNISCDVNSSSFDDLRSALNFKEVKRVYNSLYRRRSTVNATTYIANSSRTKSSDEGLDLTLIDYKQIESLATNKIARSFIEELSKVGSTPKTTN